MRSTVRCVLPYSPVYATRMHVCKLAFQVRNLYYFSIQTLIVSTHNACLVYNGFLCIGKPTQFVETCTHTHYFHNYILPLQSVRLALRYLAFTSDIVGNIR